MMVCECHDSRRIKMRRWCALACLPRNGAFANNKIPKARGNTRANPPRKIVCKPPSHQAPTRNKLLPNAIQTTNDRSVAAQHTTSCERVAERPKILIRPACVTHRDQGAREGFRGTFCGFRGHLLRNPGKASAEFCITPREPSAEVCIQIWPMPCGSLLRNLREPSAESAAAFCGRLQYPVVTILQGSSAQPTTTPHRLLRKLHPPSLSTPPAEGAKTSTEGSAEALPAMAERTFCGRTPNLPQKVLRNRGPPLLNAPSAEGGQGFHGRLCGTPSFSSSLESLSDISERPSIMSSSELLISSCCLCRVGEFQV